MKRFIPFMIFLLSILPGCRKLEDGYTVYKIKEGKHHSTRSIDFLKSDALSFYAKFDESAIYQSKDPVNQLDINKLYGFSECNQQHQKNSARFGWRWLSGQIEIMAYVYNDGQNSWKHVGYVNPGEKHLYTIRIVEDKYEFLLDGNSVMMDRTSKCDIGFFYKLYPYFGGDETAPHDIRIWIEDI